MFKFYNFDLSFFTLIFQFYIYFQANQANKQVSKRRARQKLLQEQSSL